MIYFQITYTDSRTGERITYMNIGFETKEAAEMEKNLLVREAKKYRKMSILGRVGFARASIVGINFRIKKIKGRSFAEL